MPRDLQIKHPRLKGYNQEFQDNVMPDLVRDEPERRIRVRLGLVFAAILTPPSIWLAWYWGVAIEDADSRAFHVAYLIPVLAYLSCVGTLMARTKFKLIKSITSFLGWLHKEGGDKSQLIERLSFFGLLPEHEMTHIGDVLTGLHENWPFEMCEITLTKHEGWGRNRRLVTVFKGVVLSFDLGRISQDVTIVTRNRTLGHPKLSRMIKHEGVYQDHFGEVIVRSSDIAIVETVMCKRFRDVIKDLTVSLPDLDVSCLFDHHYLHIPLEAKDRFEMDLMFDEMRSTSRVQKMLDEFSEILTLLDIILRRRSCPEAGTFDYPHFRTLG